MDLENTTRPIRDLVLAFSKGEYLLPQFQRDYVWKAAKIRNLLDSLFRDLPVGGFYLWQPLSRVADAKATAFTKVRMAKAASAYLIDGQQRLTSLEAAYGFFTGEDKRGEELRCYLDLARQDEDWDRVTRRFVTYSGNKSVKKRVDQGDPTLVAVNRFFEDKVDQEQRRQIEEALRALRWKQRRIDQAMTRYDRAYKMLNQHVPCATVRVGDEVAVELFRRLNQGGARLRESDVRAAELSRGQAVEVLKRMREFVSEERPSRLGLGFSFAFRCLVLFHRGAAQLRTLPPDWTTTTGPHKRSLAESWKITRDALSRTLKFVDERLGWSRAILIPSMNALVVLAYALDKEKGIGSSDAQRKYERWLYLTALRGVFQGSIETTINRFAKAIRETKGSPAGVLLSALKKYESAKIKPDEFLKPAQLWGPGTQVLVSWLVRQRALDWKSGETIDALARMERSPDLTIHHIFARAVAARALPNPNDVNRLANFAVVGRATNAFLKDQEPEEALKLLSSKEQARAADQFFSLEAGDRLKIDQFDEFVRWRAEKLASNMNRHLGM